MIFTFAVRPPSRRPADNHIVRVRLATSFLACCTAIAAWLLSVLPSQAVTPGPSCGEQLLKSQTGIAIRVLFAKNGAVQRYLVVDSQENMEAVNDFRLTLERQFGPAAVNAPPLHIVSFKSGGGSGMMVPDKAKDSCDRTLSFQ